jgi:hypothetical protein
MLSLLAVWTFATSRRLFQIGILVAGVGSGFVGLGAVGLVARRFGPRPAAARDTTAPAPAPMPFFVSPALIIASILLVAGFVLMLLSVHFGVSPWSGRKSG